jgi:hypothetical protein
MPTLVFEGPRRHFADISAHFALSVDGPVQLEVGLKQWEKNAGLFEFNKNFFGAGR